MFGVSRSECQILEPKSALRFSPLCLSDAISPHFDHRAFGFSRGLRAARFHRLSQLLSEDWTSSSVMADGCWYTPRLILSQIFLYSLTKKKNTHTHKPLYNSVWGSVSVSLWPSVSLSCKHFQTHWYLDLKVGNPVFYVIQQWKIIICSVIHQQGPERRRWLQKWKSMSSLYFIW